MINVVDDNVVIDVYIGLFLFGSNKLIHPHLSHSNIVEEH